MPRHRFEPPRGRIETIGIESEALRGNLLGDPTRRTVAVYLPPGHDDTDTNYPLLVGLAGYTGSGLKMLSWQFFGEKDFLLEEMLPELERRFRVRPGAAHRAVFGKSSGGYGALVQGLRHGEQWGAVACQSGDMGFELTYAIDFPKLLGVLARHDGDVSRFVEHCHETVKIRGEEVLALMGLCMAASYDPDPNAPYGVRLPVDPRTCERIEDRWQRWLEHDPLQLIEREECRSGLRALRGLFVDCGSRDQYWLQHSARRFTRRLGELGIEHTYEEFDDDHLGIDYRLDRSLPFLYAALTR